MNINAVPEPEIDLARGGYRVTLANGAHFVDKNRRCTCGRPKCPAIKAVADYLRAGGARASGQADLSARMAPHSLEAEEAVLGSLLIDPEHLSRVSFLTGGDFFLVKNQWIWEAIVALGNRREPIDFLTVCEELDRHKLLAEVGGQPYISHLINVVPTSIHAEGYARIVEATSVRRKLLTAASDVAQLAYEEAEDIDDIISRAEQTIIGVRAHRALPGLPALAAPALQAAQADSLYAWTPTCTGVMQS